MKNIFTKRDKVGFSECTIAESAEKSFEIKFRCIMNKVIKEKHVSEHLWRLLTKQKYFLDFSF